MSDLEREQLWRLCRIFDLLPGELDLVGRDPPNMQPRCEVVAA